MSQVVLSCEEMLVAHSQVVCDTMAYTGSMCLRFAVELDIPEIINAHGRPMSKAELISKFVNIPPRKAEFLVRILRLLAQMGYFKIEKHSNNNSGNDDEDETIFYSLTPLSIMLLKENLSAFVLNASNHKYVDTFQFLTNWFRSERPECVHDFLAGKSMWELANESPEYNSLFNEGMASETRVLMKGVVELCKDTFKGLRSIVDVGGGTGTAARVIAQAFPGIKCIVYDLPHVISSVPKSSLIEAIGGDMFEHVPQADAIFLKYILHDWNDENCVKILNKCKEAIPASGGKVIIVDTVLLNEGKASTESVAKLISDVTMMTFVDGKEREEHQWKKIFTEAGFPNYKITPVGMQSLIELFP